MPLFPPSGGGAGSVNVSAGTTSNNLTAVTFSNANGVSFGLNGSVITGTVATNYQAPGAYLTTAMASNRGSDFVQAAAAFAGTSASGTIASNGISVSIGPYITTGMLSNAVTLSNIRVSAGTTSNLLSAITFSNGSGISFGLNGSVITGTVQTNYLTTAALSDHSHGNPQLNLTNVSGTTASNSAGFTLSLSAAAPGAGGGFAAQGSGAYTQNTGTIQFANSNGITFGLSTNQMTASHNGLTTGRASNDGVGLNTALTAGPLAWTVNSAGISLNAASAAGTTSGFTGANISMSMTHNTGGLAISASVAAGGPGGGATISTYHNHPINILTTVGAPVNASATIMFLPMREAVTATRLDLPVSVAVASAANTSSAAILYTLSAYIYTKNGATLNTLSSGQGSGTHTWNSNATGSMSGGRFFSAAMNVNASAGNYFIGLHLSTRATGHAGPGSTSLGNTITMLGVGTAMAGAITFADFNAVTASSNGWYTVGLNSSTGNLTQVSLSNVTQAGSGFQRANIALRMYM